MKDECLRKRVISDGSATVNYSDILAFSLETELKLCSLISYSRKLEKNVLRCLLMIAPLISSHATNAAAVQS